MNWNFIISVSIRKILWGYILIDIIDINWCNCLIILSKLSKIKNKNKKENAKCYSTACRISTDLEKTEYRRVVKMDRVKRVLCSEAWLQDRQTNLPLILLMNIFFLLYIISITMNGKKKKIEKGRVVKAQACCAIIVESWERAKRDNVCCISACLTESQRRPQITGGVCAFTVTSRHVLALKITVQFWTVARVYVWLAEDFIITWAL